MPSCANCGEPYQIPVHRTTLCPSCEHELKTCQNCRHYSPGMANDCREPVSEPVREKDRANFCDWFSPAPDAGAGKRGARKQDNPRQAFEDLFKNG